MHGYERTIKNHFYSSLLYTFLLYSTSFYPFTDIPLFYLFCHLVFNSLYVWQNPLRDFQGLLLFTQVSVEVPLILTQSCSILNTTLSCHSSHSCLILSCVTWTCHLGLCFYRVQYLDTAEGSCVSEIMQYEEICFDKLPKSSKEYLTEETTLRIPPAVHHVSQCWIHHLFLSEQL